MVVMIQDGTEHGHDLQSYTQEEKLRVQGVEACDAGMVEGLPQRRMLGAVPR
jgi:hypothetical protein